MRTVFLLIGVVVAIYYCGPARASTLTIGDSKLYTVGPYGAFNAPFKASAMGLVRGSDFADQMTLDTIKFPSDTLMTWKWPNNPEGCKKNICGFMAIDYGDYDGTRVAQPIVAKPISSITMLQLSLVASYGGDDQGSTEGYDSIIDLFLTSSPGGGQNHLAEIEIFLHTPKFASEWVERQRVVGSYTDSNGASWNITRAGEDFLVLPASKGDIDRASVDIRGLLQYLVEVRQITGREYFNGLGVGVEPKYSSGKMSIQSLAVTYK